MPGIIAGAYLGGKRGLMMMENSGLRQACEPIARFMYTHHMPLVMAMAFRGDFGEPNWWGHAHGETMEPILNALRIRTHFVSTLDDIKPSIKKAFVHADAGQSAVALVFRGECVEAAAPHVQD
jgi:sulfopyruvate decarboxylase subunit alpha